MALEPFDANKHHIGLGSAFSKDGFILVGGYEVSGQRVAPQSTDYGGDKDLLSPPGLSRWTQDDFSGGIFRNTWGKDPAMFATSENIVRSLAERSVRTVPPLIQYTAYPTADPGSFYDGITFTPLLLFAADGYIFACGAAAIDRYNLDDNTVTRFDNPADLSLDPDEEWLSFAFDPADSILYILKPHDIDRYNVPALTAASITHFLPPTSITNSLTGFGVLGQIQVGRGILLFTAGNRLYRLLIPANKETGVPATDDWLYVDKLPGEMVDSCNSQGITYILCSDPDRPTAVLSYDGAALVPLVEFPYNFEGRSITTYAGRVYVGGAGRDVSGDKYFGELYEITGSSLRLLKSFAEEVGRSFASRPKTIEAMCVHEGMLWFGDDGHGLIAYDVSTDAFFGASQFVGGVDAHLGFVKMCAARGALYPWLFHDLTEADTGLYRILQSTDVGGTPFVGRVATSEFAPEPDRQKRWSAIRVLTRYNDVDLHYSIDDGSSWTPLGDPDEVDTRSGLITSTWTTSVLAIPATNGIRFRFSMERGSVAAYGELIAFTLAFAMVDDGKLRWNFTVNGSAIVEYADRSANVTQDVRLIGDTLRGYWQDNPATPLVFRDVDGRDYNVQLVDFHESQPTIAPTFDAGGGVTPGREAFYSITLLEV